MGLRECQGPGKSDTGNDLPFSSAHLCCLAQFVAFSFYFPMQVPSCRFFLFVCVLKEQHEWSSWRCFQKTKEQLDLGYAQGALPPDVADLD
jgi:hypothetical protein